MSLRTGIAVLGIVCWTALSAVAELENPVWPRSTPDPTCWRAPDGTWRLASTSQRILKSRDFFTWEDTGKRLFTPEDERRIRDEWKNIWAPDVIKLNNEYRLYVTQIRNAEESAIFVYSSKSPDGPFTDGQMLTYGKETGIIDTIDAEVVREYGTGKLWLFFGSTGRIHRVPLAPDGKSLAKGAKPEHVAGRHINENHDRLHVFEGTYLHRRNGWWYLFASRGRFGDWSYAIVVGRAKKLSDPFFDRDGRAMKDGHGTVVLYSDKGDAFFGPGHNGEIVNLRGHDYMPFHCHVAGPRPGDRPLFIQEVFWDRDGWPSFAAAKPQKNPKAPKQVQEKKAK